MSTIEPFEQAKERLAQYLDDRDRAVAEKDGWHFGEKVQIIEDAEQPDTVYEGDEGFLILETVGAPEFGNERVAAFIVQPGLVDPVEVDLGNVQST
jgi:hypothetical protein